MAISSFLQTLDNSRLNSTIKKPQTLTSVGSSGPGTITQTLLNNSKSNAEDIYKQYQNTKNLSLAQNILNQSAGSVPVDEYGIVKRPESNFKDISTANIGTVGQIGKTALQGTEDAATWQKLKKIQDFTNNYNVSTVFGVGYDPNNLPAGSNAKNPGAQAVAIAITAYKNHTPYSWGGNSLVNGVDCSGLIQQAYAKLGIKLPRTTYEQAKSGQIIKGIQNALPGDLVFYNTGSNDPNGVGTNSHVALYLGNGMVIEALNNKVGIREAKFDASGTPSTIVRPWS